MQDVPESGTKKGRVRMEHITVFIDKETFQEEEWLHERSGIDDGENERVSEKTGRLLS